jgi:hypothetical protein
MSTIKTGVDPDRSIPEFLCKVRGGLEGRWVLVARLDSSPVRHESPTLQKAIAGSAEQALWTDAGIVVPGSCILRIIEQETLFFGFDEVVVLERSPVALPAIPVVFTSDSSLSEEDSRVLLSYLVEHEAVAAAGDGVGLRWFTLT